MIDAARREHVAQTGVAVALDFRKIVSAAFAAAPKVEPDSEDMEAVGRDLMQALSNYTTGIKKHLPEWRPMDSPAEIVGDLLNALDEAARMVEQEPVAWMVEAESGKAINHLTISKIVVDAIIECGRAKSVTPLYAAPPDAEALRADAAYWEEEARRYCGNADRWHARVTELEAALLHISEYWNGHESERAMNNALHHIINEAQRVLIPKAARAAIAKESRS